MSTYGARSYLAAPLELRTATLLQLANPTLPLGPEVPVSSNRFLMTSGGLLSPQDAVSLSSVTCSTSAASTACLTSLQSVTAAAVGLYASTATLGPTTFSTLIGSTLFGTTLSASLLTAPSLTTTLLNSSTMIGDLGSAVTLSTLSYRLSMDALNMTIPIGALTSVTATGQSAVMGTTSTTTTTTTTVSASAASTASLVASSLTVASLAASTLSFVTITSGDLMVGGVSLASTFTASSLVTQNTTYDYLSTTYLSTTVISTSNLAGSTLTGNTATFSTLQTSSMTAGTLSTLTNGSMSALTAQSLGASTFSASTLNGGAVYGSTLAVSSALTASFVATGSTLLSSAVTSTLSANVLSASTLITATATGGSGTANVIRVPVSAWSTLYASTFLLDTATALTAAAVATTPLLTASTLVAVTISTSLTTSTVITSTLTGQPQPTRVTASTCTVSTLTVSTLNGMVVGTTTLTAAAPSAAATGLVAIGGSYTGAASTAVLVGYQVVPQAVQVSTLIAVGAFAASTLQAGMGGLYLGANAQASAPSVSGESVIGSGIGSGAGTLTVGTAATVATRLYGSVGIGTTVPLATLDVRGATTVIAASTIYNTTLPGAVGNTVSLSMTAGSQTATLFLNDGLSVTEGGPSAATLRCLSGIQCIGSGATDAGLYVTPAGAVGIGTVPLYALDVMGAARSQADGVSTEMPTNDSVAVFSPLLSAYLWMGYDPTADLAYINAGQTTAWPLVLQPTGGSVGIGTTAPRALLDVVGAAQIIAGIQTGALSVGSATVGGSPLVSGSPWVLSGGVLSYTGNVSVGSVSAATYLGLPVATASSAGIVQIGAGLAVNGGLSVALPFLSCRCAGSAVAWRGGWIVVLTAVYQQGITTGVTVAVAGTYEVTLSGAETATDTLSIWRGAVQVGAVDAVGGAVMGKFFVDLVPTDQLYVTSQHQTGVEGLLLCMWGVA